MLNLNRKFICLLTLVVAACSNTSANVNTNTDEQFESNFKYLTSDFDLERRRVFRELYGFEKAKLEAKEYCKKLDKGESQWGEIVKYNDSLLDKVDTKVISEEERDAMVEVKFSIFSAAEITYCPQHIEKGRIPLSERLKK